MFEIRHSFDTYHLIQNVEILAYQRSSFFKLNKNKPLYIYENNLCSYFYLDDKKPRKLGMILHQNI